MKTKFCLLLILFLAVASCNQKSLNDAGNAVVTTEDGATWCIMPYATITNPEIKDILTDTVIPFLKKNLYSPKNYYISIWIADYKDDENGNVRNLIIQCEPQYFFNVFSENSYKEIIYAYSYIDDYLVVLSYRLGIEPFFKTDKKYLAFKDTGYKEPSEESFDDSIFYLIWWYYHINDGKMNLYNTNHMDRTQTCISSSNDTICIRPVNENKEIIF